MPTHKTGLGKGFDSLIPEDFDSSILVGKDEQIQKLSLDKIKPNADQPRKNFDKTALDELASSIKQHGIVQPLIVTPTSDNEFTIIAGERRWRAAKKAGLSHVPTIIRSAKELEQLELAIVENVQRVDLSPLEQAVSISRLHDQFNVEYPDIAKRLGKATTTIQNTARLLQLPPKAKEALQKGEITEGHARSVLSLKQTSKQMELVNLIKSKHLSVRQAEQYVTAHKTGANTLKTAQKRMRPTTTQTKKLAAKLKTPVSLRRLAKGGKLEIRFIDENDLKRIIQQLLI